MSGATTRKDAARAIKMLSQVDAPLVGTVLNGVTGEAGYGYAYDYGNYRGDASGRREPAPEPSTRPLGLYPGGVGRQHRPA